MADNTISPVVPNVSGGRNVSTGQKAVTQTAAQSGIDFKSYLGGRTAVQDNSTTFLKRRNSYTLNKNNTKEISIKTASKNSPTESEVKKITDDISSQIVEKVTDDLDISEDELNNAMQLLGLTAMDLLNPANLSALYCEVTGNASDPQALVLNADFTALFNDVSQVASENDAQLDLLSQLTASDDGEILDADIVSSADTTEKTVDSSYDDTAASGQNINDTADEAVKVYDGGTQDSSYQNSDEGTSSGETGNGIISDENTEKTQSKSQVDSSFDDSGERVLHHDDDAHSDNSVLHASVSEQLNTDTSFEMSQSQSRLRVDTTDIIRQIVDSMSISNTTEESAINLQLTPESLGRMYINVSQKNSEISARIAVSNEAVKEALQTQMVNLKEALNNSGIRVNEVEITVASHEFERNLEQVVLVQHMPAGFTKSMAERLNELSQVQVKEASNGEVLKNGVVYIAPGGTHIAIKKSGASHVISFNDMPPISGLKPCANIMFDSLTSSNYDEVVCVVLTGMGADGTNGILSLGKSKPIYVIAQDEKSSVVYGMPRAIYEAGVVDEVVTLSDVAKAITKNVGVK